MKVVLFCGGLGMRIRDYSDHVPKPMVPVGDRPIIWHLMKYYAHFGHADFILCLGYKAECITEYFRNEAAGIDREGWKVTLAETGVDTNIGGRLMAVRRLLEDEPAFLANYTDTLSDLDLDELIASVRARGAIAGFAAVHPNLSSHIITADEGGVVNRFGTVATEGIWSNGGYFVFTPAIFDYMRGGEELVEQPFQRLIVRKKLYAHRHRGFWTSMDTFKEKQQLDALHARGNPPWEVWRQMPRRSG